MKEVNQGTFVYQPTVRPLAATRSERERLLVWDGEAVSAAELYQEDQCIGLVEFACGFVDWHFRTTGGINMRPHKPKKSRMKYCDEKVVKHHLDKKSHKRARKSRVAWLMKKQKVEDEMNQPWGQYEQV